MFMAKFSGGNCDGRRESTVKRHDEVHRAYDDVVCHLGDLAQVVSKAYIYDRIRERTGLCTKTIAYVLNHTREIGL